MNNSSQSELSQLSDDEKTALLAEAEQHKAQGTTHFRSSDWQEAIQCYSLGLNVLPKRPAALEISSENQSDGPAESPLPEPSTIDLECAKARSILNGNIAACYYKLGDHKEAVRSCDEALIDDPNYVKVLERRVTSNDAINTWTSLVEAQKDLQKLAVIYENSGSAQLPSVRRRLRELEPRIQVSQEKEKAEMVSKLKDLGNNLLGNFGLSTDNFKFEPNGQGGYSMNFVR